MTVRDDDRIGRLVFANLKTQEVVDAIQATFSTVSVKTGRV
jgi:hypothetical protein